MINNIKIIPWNVCSIMRYLGPTAESRAPNRTGFRLLQSRKPSSYFLNASMLSLLPG